MGAERGLEKDLVPKAGYRLPHRPHLQLSPLLSSPQEMQHNLISVCNLMRAPREARAILKEFQPDCGGGHRRLCQLSHGEGGGQGRDPHRGP